MSRFAVPAGALIIAAGFLVGAQGVVRLARPIAAGTWYPADKDKLKADIAKYLNEAQGTTPPGHCVACVLPHAPYSTGGPIAAPALKCLKPGAYDRVIVLAGSHFSSFRGCSMPSVQAYITPLGEVVVDCPAIRLLDRSTLMETRSLRYEGNVERKMVHEREYTIEVVLPYLQERLGKFRLVPILVGEFENYRGETDEDALEAVAKTIAPFYDSRTLLVVSTDLTHFGNRFSYRPFRGDDILKGIRMLDQNALDLLVKRNYPEFQRYLAETQNTICGKMALALMLRLLPRNAEGHVLSHAISAEKTGDTSTSISYASIVYMTPGDAPADETANERP